MGRGEKRDAVIHGEAYTGCVTLPFRLLAPNGERQPPRAVRHIASLYRKRRCGASRFGKCRTALGRLHAWCATRSLETYPKDRGMSGEGQGCFGILFFDNCVFMRVRRSISYSRLPDERERFPVRWSGKPGFKAGGKAGKRRVRRGDPGKHMAMDNESEAVVEASSSRTCQR